MKSEGLQDSLVTRGRTIVSRAALLCVVWWTLTEGEVSGAGLGAVVVVLALAVSLAIAPSRVPWRARGTVALAVRFFVDSLRGGIDVARRALARDLPLSPTVIRYRVRLTSVSSQQLFTGAVSLMPGTLSIALVDRDLDIHVLVDDPRAHRRLERFECAIARALGESLEGARA